MRKRAAPAFVQFVQGGSGVSRSPPNVGQPHPAGMIRQLRFLVS